LNSPLTDPPISNGRLRGRAAKSTERQPDRSNSAGPTGVNPASNPIDIAMTKGGRGTPGRKTYPNLGI